VLGPPQPSLREAVRATVEQVPRPFGVLLVDGVDRDGTAGSTEIDKDLWNGLVEDRHVVARVTGIPTPRELLGLLLAIQRGGRGSSIPEGSR